MIINNIQMFSEFICGANKIFDLKELKLCPDTS